MVTFYLILQNHLNNVKVAPREQMKKCTRDLLPSSTCKCLKLQNMNCYYMLLIFQKYINKCSIKSNSRNPVPLALTIYANVQQSNSRNPVPLALTIYANVQQSNSRNPVPLALTIYANIQQSKKLASASLCT